jgi:hypothetical protein
VRTLEIAYVTRKLAATLGDVDADAFIKTFEETPLFKQMERTVAGGDYSALDSEARQQHFIPRFHLKRFSQERDGKNYLFQLDVHSGQPKRIQPEQAASGRYFYAVTDDEGTRHNRIEGFLAVVENHAAPAFARLLADPKKLSGSDRATIAFFLALLDVRTPGGTERGANMLDTMMRMMFASNFSDAPNFAKKYRELFGEANDEEIEEFRRRTLGMLRSDEVGYDSPRTAALSTGFRASGEIAAHIFGMTWTVLGSTDEYFVTSDRGLAMFDPKPKYPWSGNSWESSPKAQTTIPLSSQICLLIEPGGRDDPEVVDVDPGLVEEINLRTYGWAGDYVYGETQEIVVNLRRVAKRRPAEIVRPKTNHQVVVFEADPADRSLAEEHRRRGWPPYLPVNGEPHDYMVIGLEGKPVETMESTTELVKQRARRVLGLRDDEPLPGKPGFDPVNLGE